MHAPAIDLIRLSGLSRQSSEIKPNRHKIGLQINLKSILGYYIINKFNNTSLSLLYNFDVICSLLLNRCSATWNQFVK